MKHLKKLNLLVVALAALAAFAAPVSADVLTSPEGKIYEGDLTAVNENGHVKLEGPLGVNILCSGHILGEITSQGEKQPVLGKVKTFEFTSCTNGYFVTVLNTGELKGEALNGGPDGTIISTGAEITVHTPLGFNCLYKTNNTTIATATSSVTIEEEEEEEKQATLDMGGTIPRTGHSALCGANGVLSGAAKVTEPPFLMADES